jgi:7-carboxy-7-deazaguanine synthase
VLSELFGPTFQGEGPSAGRRAAFLRLGLCNLDCSWCDTPYTWDWTGRNGPPQDRTLLRQVRPTDVYDELKAMDVRLVVITGGEPMIQQRSMLPLAEQLVTHGMEVEVETNGTLPVERGLIRFPALIRWNVSPKLSGSGVDRDKAIRPDVLRQLLGIGARLKFVVTHTGELDEIAALVDELDAPPDRVWVMPEGRTSYAITDAARALAEPVLARGWNLSTRLHVLLWEDERGR